jgi:hypothetical protein
LLVCDWAVGILRHLADQLQANSRNPTAHSTQRTAHSTQHTAHRKHQTANTIHKMSNLNDEPPVKRFRSDPPCASPASVSSACPSPGKRSSTPSDDHSECIDLYVKRPRLVGKDLVRSLLGKRSCVWGTPQPAKRYEYTRPLGAGTYGCVFACELSVLCPRASAAPFGRPSTSTRRKSWR